ncbi:tRNA (adenosine(37)-N6)-threonylcarbamoyltransferase complex ATPase subunit type 1 TsaE [Chloroflexota bacterium]
MPILDKHTLDFISHSPAQSLRLGTRLGSLLQVGDIICLEGDLGTGKTCLTQGMGRGMGITQPITSPTFTLVAEYQPPSAGPLLYHVDLYRLHAPIEEAWAFGLDEYLSGIGVCVIEWAERIAEALPSERLWITLHHLDASKRSITMTAQGNHYDKLLRRFRTAAFGV